MKSVIYLSLVEALELHSQLIKRFGGKGGVRDLGLLESALMRPQTGYYDTLTLQAAALLQSLTQNHAFIDGNKRVAFAATAIFLRMNNYKIKVNAIEGERFIIEVVINKRADIEVVARWLEKHIDAVKN